MTSLLAANGSETEMFVIAFDHPIQFSNWRRRRKRTNRACPKLKNLFVEAVAQTEQACSLSGSVGMLCDDRYGQDALDAATGRGWWIGGDAAPGSNPLQMTLPGHDRHDIH